VIKSAVEAEAKQQDAGDKKGKVEEDDNGDTDGKEMDLYWAELYK